MVREMRARMRILSTIGGAFTWVLVGGGTLAALAVALSLNVLAAPGTAASASVPPVLLSAEHTKLCKLAVGDQFPAIELPTLEGAATKVADLAKGKPTVVLFWSPDRWMSRTALADLGKIVAGKTGSSIAAVAIVEGPANDQVAKAIADAGATLPQLADANGAAFAQVGEHALPRIFVLDKAGKVAWFDIEFSEASRRELHQTLAALAK